MNDLVKIILWVVVIASQFLAHNDANAQPVPDKTDTIRNRFERQVTNLYQEKVFLHFDRTSYITGETIWFSAYCVDATFHTPADLSRVLNVELLDASGQAVKQARVALTDGHGKGQIFVAPDIQSGHYIVRAYTNWMKNFRPEFAFRMHIKIVNPSSIRDTGVAGSDKEAVINFFPEGGQLVAGLKSKVAVKATDGYGNGLSVAGIIYDDRDQEVAEFSTSALGYSYFLLTPDKNKSYAARVELDSAIHKYQLPAVMKTGLTLAADLSEDGNLKISVECTTDFQDSPYLVVHTRGIISQLVHMDLKQVKQLNIESNELPAGITHITLLSSDFDPLCERLIFKYPDITELIELNSKGREYRKREQVAISLRLNEKFTRDDLAHLSVSVYHAGNAGHDRDNIVSNLLLTSDLTGPIPDPWVFFNPENKSRARQLDLVMLTNGWRRFDWNDIKSNQQVPLKHPAEINAPILSGQFRKNEQENLPKSLQVNFWGKASVMNSIGLNPDGLFHAEVPFRVNSEKVLFSLNDDTLRSDQVSLFSPFDLQHTDADVNTFSEFSPDSRDYLETLNTNIQVLQVYRDYNHINGLQTDVQQTNTAFYGTPDLLYVLDDYTRFETIGDLFLEYIRSAAIRDNRRGSGFHILYDDGTLSGKALTLIDGVPVDDFDYIMNYDPLKIEKISIVKNVYRMGNIEYPGIIDFTTYQGDFDGQELPGYIVEKVYHGLQSPRVFHAPDYSVNQDQLKRIPDYRNTLYWDPHVEIRGSKGAELQFYTSDDMGLYQIEVNGITNNGQPVFLGSSFVVK